MIKYTTPTISLIVEGVDLSDQNVYVTLEQGTNELTKSGNDLSVQAQTRGQTTDTSITFTLTQEESASFNYNANVSVQVNWILNGVRSATEIKGIPVMRNLLDEVL